MQGDFENIVHSYAVSPLGNNSEKKLESVDMKYKWAGSNADHAADGKKAHTIGQKDKTEAIKMDLGTKLLLDEGPNALICHEHFMIPLFPFPSA